MRRFFLFVCFCFFSEKGHLKTDNSIYGKPFYYLLGNVDILFIYKISYILYLSYILYGISNMIYKIYNIIYMRYLIKDISYLIYFYQISYSVLQFR